MIVWLISIDVQVRATALVHDAFQKGLLPPIIQPHELDGRLRNPDLKELREVLNLHHLARCAEIQYTAAWFQFRDCEFQFCGEEETRWLGGHELWNHPEHTETWNVLGGPVADQAVWRDRFDPSLYTLLLLGAVLSRSYNEPFFDMTASPAGVSLRDKIHRATADRSESVNLSEPELEYMLQFPVSHLHVDVTRQEQVFGALASWFIKHALEMAQTRSRFISRPSGPGYPPVHDKLFDVGAGFWPESSSLSDSFVRGSPDEGRLVFCAVMDSLHMLDFFINWLWANQSRKPASLERREEEAKIVMFGMFRPQRVSMPLHLVDTLGPGITVQPYYHEADLILSWPALHLGFAALHSSPYYPHRGGTAHGSKVPVVSHYPLTFFSFLLARDFGIRLVEGEAGTYWAPF